jgi:hypothetical protein
VNAIGGVATFSDLTLNKPAAGYTLTASSPGLTGATSGTFSIDDQALSCTAQTTSCAVDDGNSAGDAQIVANSVDPGLLIESVNANGGAPLTCVGYTTNDPTTYTFDTTSSNWSKVVTVTIHDPINPTNSGAAHQLGGQQLCLQAPYPFTTDVRQAGNEVDASERLARLHRPAAQLPSGGRPLPRPRIRREDPQPQQLDRLGHHPRRRLPRRSTRRPPDELTYMAPVRADCATRGPLNGRSAPQKSIFVVFVREQERA